MKFFIAAAIATAVFAQDSEAAAEPTVDPRIADLEEPLKSMIPKDCTLESEE